MGFFSRLFGGATPSLPDEPAPAPGGAMITAAQLPERLSVLPLRNAVFFPAGLLPVAVGVPASRRLLREAVDTHGLVLVVTQRHSEDVDPKPVDLYDVGTIARVTQLSDRRGEPDVLDAMLQGVGRGRLLHFTRESPFLVARVQLLSTTELDGPGIEPGIGALRALALECAEFLTEHREQAKQLITHVTIPEHLVDLIVANFEVPLVHKQRILELPDLPSRLQLATELLERKLTAFHEREVKPAS